MSRKKRSKPGKGRFRLKEEECVCVCVKEREDMRMQIHFEPRELWKFWKKEFPDHDFTTSSKVRYLTWKDCMKRGREKKNYIASSYQPAY